MKRELYTVRFREDTIKEVQVYANSPKEAKNKVEMGDYGDSSVEFVELIDDGFYVDSVSKNGKEYSERYIGSLGI